MREASSGDEEEDEEYDYGAAAGSSGRRDYVESHFNPTLPAHLSIAKSVLHASMGNPAPGSVRCRETERKSVIDLILKCLKNRRSGSMYVCGLPGTGKSLTISEAEKAVRCWGDNSAKSGGGGGGGGAGGSNKHAAAAAAAAGRGDRPLVAAVNCMALSEPRQVFARIIEALGGVPPSLAAESGIGSMGEVSDISQLPEVSALRQMVTGDLVPSAKGGGALVPAASSSAAGKVGPMVVILLDEMDQLMSKAQGILYELFGLPTLKGSRCVLVGVANGINLVEVTLPRLAARGCEPKVVRFNAYDKDQIKSLLKQRLGPLPWAVFEDAGLELCARKVAAATGDMRRALNICTSAVDLCGAEAAAAAAAAEEAGAGAETTATAAAAAAAAGAGAGRPDAGPARTMVKLSHMARAISASFASPVVDTMRALPQQQQMVLCAAVRLFRHAARRETTLGGLNDRYTALCKEAGIRGLNPSEFSGVCNNLSDMTLLKVSPGREDRQRKVSLAVHQDDVVFALQGVNFFRNLIGGEGGGGGGGGGAKSAAAGAGAGARGAAGR